ncbi:hypothetical protein IJG79_01735 [Candidatus Saccharibacteria bacterium]|nr:hypothetical protein [Candidatus Saccharibacteria bacterium]
MAIQIRKAQLNKLIKLAEGGEATIYSYDKNTVLKIFKNPAVLPVKEQKVKAMLGKKSRGDLAILPMDTVMMDNKFVGYQMPIVVCGEPLHSFTKARFVRDHSFTNLDALQIISQLAHAIDDVHNAGFIIGDVSDNNFMASIEPGHQIHLIDTDSWGINGLAPDAYTETFTPPEAYNAKKGMRLTEETDNFGFRVLAFNVLTRIHPFGGNYKKTPNMNTVERIKNKLSLLGSHDIVYNDALFNWSWMSPNLLETMKDAFEGDRRDAITDELDDQLAHSKLCKVHNLYYYDCYTDCPLCSGVAKLKQVTQVVVATTATGPKVVLAFSDPNVHIMLDQNTYFDTSGNIVYIPTGKSFPRRSNTRMHFASGGRYLISMLRSKLIIQNDEGAEVAEIERMTNSSYAIEGASVLFVDRGDLLHRMLLSVAGLQDEVLFQASNPLLALNELGEHFVVNRYHDRIMVSYKDHDVEITGTPQIREYAIKFDAVTKTWVFIYEESSGAFRTMVFGANGKEYDDNIVRYSAVPLSNIAYRNGTVYDPGIKAFTGTNLKKGSSKVFQCDAVDETCMLRLDGNSFIIVGDTTVQRFG